MQGSSRWWLCVLCTTASCLIFFLPASLHTHAFLQQTSPRVSMNHGHAMSRSRLQLSTPSKTTSEASIESLPCFVPVDKLVFPDNIGREWELDCYSRPVMNDDGKKLWELLLTDSQSDFRYVKVLPSNLVNSRNVRKVIEDVLEAAPVRPKTIRFFRNQMFNMLTIALQGIPNLEVKPSRATANLFMWLQDREDYLYPKMKGYNPQLRQQTIFDYEVNKADPLPDVIKSEKYAFVALPAEAFWKQEVSAENIKQGKMIPIRDMPPTGWIHGITLFTSRAKSVAAWLNGMEISHMKAELVSRELLMHTGISSQFIVALLTDKQKKEAQIFEKGKNDAVGYHFLSVQEKPDSEEVEGFWLLRQFGNNL